MTDEALTSLGKKVPDLCNYSMSNSFINYSQNIDEQLCSLMDINKEEFEYIKNTIDSIR